VRALAVLDDVRDREAGGGAVQDPAEVEFHGPLAVVLRPRRPQEEDMLGNAPESLGDLLVQLPDTLEDERIGQDRRSHRDLSLRKRIGSGVLAAQGPRWKRHTPGELEELDPIEEVVAKRD
jgi:hypothetical protein